MMHGTVRLVLQHRRFETVCSRYRGDELLAEYKSFVADLALREHGKVEKIDKFFEPHLKNAGFSGNFTIRDVFDRKSKVSKWMKARKK